MVTCNSKDKIAYVFRQDCIFKGHKSSKIYHKSFAVRLPCIIFVRFVWIFVLKTHRTSCYECKNTDFIEI